MNKMLLRSPCSSCCQVLSQRHSQNSFWCTGMMDTGYANLTGNTGQWGQVPDATIPHTQTVQTGYSACSFTPIQGFCFSFWKGWDADTGRTLQDQNTAGSLHYSTPQKLSRAALTQREHPSIHTPL